MAEGAPSWAEVEARYDDPAAHDAFLAACRENGALPHAATCYRGVLAARPDDPIALKRLKQIVALAMLAMNLDSARREAATVTPGRTLRASFGTGVIGAVIGGLAALVPKAGTEPEAATGICDGLLRGSPICVFPLLPGALLPYAFLGGLAGLVLGLVIARVRLRS